MVRRPAVPREGSHQARIWREQPAGRGQGVRRSALPRPPRARQHRQRRHRAAGTPERDRRLQSAGVGFCRERDTARVWRDAPVRSALLRDWLLRFSFAAANPLVRPPAAPCEPVLPAAPSSRTKRRTPLILRVSPRFVIDRSVTSGIRPPRSRDPQEMWLIGTTVEVRNRWRRAVARAPATERPRPIGRKRREVSAGGSRPIGPTGEPGTCSRSTSVRWHPGSGSGRHQAAVRSRSAGCGACAGRP